MNYELAKELEEAGFNQVGGGDYLEGAIESDETGIITTNSVYAPTLSELIEACEGGKRLFELWHGMGKTHGWNATCRARCARGTTPEEAVARLWLALNKK